MECKFIQHGLAISYDHVVKPCCEWKSTDQFKTTHLLERTDLATWHQHTDIVSAKEQLEQGTWPTACSYCKGREDLNRGDSMRLNGANSYANYQADDITLEIRPGNVCNFACQTCWPAASTRVAEYQVRAGLVTRDQIYSKSIDDYNFLLPVADRIKNVIVLGGEPFYDPACKKFISWAQEHLTADLLLFTNGSVVDWDFLTNYPGKITLVFSLDAVGLPAEYIRFGTKWATVLDNYQRVSQLSNVDVRVNVTTSAYNYTYLESLIDLLCQRWPDVVTFGSAFQPFMAESVIAESARPNVVASLQRAIDQVELTDIEAGQKANAMNALLSIINQLNTVPYNSDFNQRFVDYIRRLDQVKHINVQDYCPELVEAIEFN